MNCQEFEQQLQARLDERQNPASDPELAWHAEICGGCQESLDTWMKVASLMPPCPAQTQPPAREPALREPALREPDLRDPALRELALRERARGGLSGQSKVRFLVSGGLAAAVLLFFLVPEVPERSLPVPSVASATQADTETSTVLPNAFTYSVVDDDLVAWWERVDGQEWVNQTMPTFRSMREGVAPLGRTLVRAVTILTIGSRDQTS